MGMLEQTAAQYRSLRMTSIAAELAQLLVPRPKPVKCRS